MRLLCVPAPAKRKDGASYEVPSQMPVVGERWIRLFVTAFGRSQLAVAILYNQIGDL